MRLKSIITTLLILVFVNVKCQEKIPDGCYRNNLGHVYEFYSDTLEFIGVFNHTVKKGKGNYSIANDTLICHFEADTVDFYVLKSKSNLTVSHDSILIKIIDNEKMEPLAAEIFSKKSSVPPLTYNGEIKARRDALPIEIGLFGFDPIYISENDFIKTNYILLEINMTHCYSVISGIRKYHLLIKQDTLVIDNEIFRLEKSCNKLMIIE